MKLQMSLLLAWLLIAAQDPALVAITSPVPDELVRGQVVVTGRIGAAGPVAAQLDFAYASDPTGTWFVIETFSESPPGATLATWDTTSITDGNYVLRLRVFLQDGTIQEATVPVTLGNDLLPTPTPEPTQTPEPEPLLAPTAFLLAASPTPTLLPRATPTSMPVNPVSLRQPQVYASLGRGALVILVLFAMAGLILRVRRF